VIEEGLHPRASQGTSVAPTEIVKQHLPDEGPASEARTEDGVVRTGKSRKGRFSVSTANTVPLQRMYLSTCAPPRLAPASAPPRLAPCGGCVVMRLLSPAACCAHAVMRVISPAVRAAALATDGERSLTAEALTALDKEAHPLAHGGRSDEVATARSVQDVPCFSPAHTASTHGELEPAQHVGAVAATDAALETMAAATAALPGGAAAKDAGKKGSRFKVVRVVENRADAAASSARASSETVAAGAPSAPVSAHGGLAANGAAPETLAIINKKLQARPLSALGHCFRSSRGPHGLTRMHFAAALSLTAPCRSSCRRTRCSRTRFACSCRRSASAARARRCP
jgi:hypothetical protein